MRTKLPDISRTQLNDAINEWILKEKYREILRLRLLDGRTYGEIAELVDMSERQIKNIVYKCEDKIFRHI